MTDGLGLGSLRARYLAKELTPAAVLTDLWPHLEASLDDHIWIHLASLDELLERCADLELADPGHLPLWGVPFAVKDNIDHVGWPTTAGCPAYTYVPDRTATVVQTLLDAGAILVGKTNLDQFATGLVGTRSPFGVPTNPHDPTLPPGGSSSGSAVAVAAGLVSFALGTDTAGSGRVPTVLTATVGLKPAPGQWPMDGVVPACRSLDCVSVFATSVGDAEQVGAVIGGEPWGGTTSGVRVGVPNDAVLAQCSDDVVGSFRAQIAALSAAGHALVEIGLDPFLATGALLYDGPWVVERAAAVGDFIRDHPDEVEPVVAAIILGGFDVTGVEVVRGQERLDVQRAMMEQVWAEVDVIVTPTVPAIPTLDDISAAPIDANRALGLFTHPVNLLGLCSVSVPGERGPGGSPTGLSVVAPAGREAMVVTAARDAAGELPPAVGAVGGDPTHVELVVVGAHLSGQPLNWQLVDRGGVLVASTLTAPTYRLFRLDEPGPARPGLERVATGGAEIEVEVWSVPVAGFGALVAAIPPPLGIGTVELADGRRVPGFICEPLGLVGAEDITDHGGWVRYLADLPAADR